MDTLQTPCLLLDEGRVTRNIARMTRHLAARGVPLRAHLKTAKCVEVAHRMMASPEGPAAVSTLKEAEQFAAGGVRDILYAVGIVPAKLDRVSALRARGVDLMVVVDSVEAAQAVAAHARLTNDKVPALIEIDDNGHRSGVDATDAKTLLEIGRTLADGAELRGVMIHAGSSYACRDHPSLVAAAERERETAVAAATILRSAGLPCPVVSVGSTPTAYSATDLSGVTEVRAGVFVFFDLVMAGLGVCSVDDIAITVLASVIGASPRHGHLVVDAGWMALSRDRGTAGQSLDQGYGRACDLAGRPYSDLIVCDANQEHGVVGRTPGSDAPLPHLSIGDRVRILPNHACATAAQHDRYHVVADGSDHVHATWSRFSGW